MWTKDRSHASYATKWARENVNFVQSHVTKSLYIWERANGKAIERDQRRRHAQKRWNR